MCHISSLLRRHAVVQTVYIVPVDYTDPSWAAARSSNERWEIRCWRPAPPNRSEARWLLLFSTPCCSTHLQMEHSQWVLQETCYGLQYKEYSRTQHNSRCCANIPSESPPLRIPTVLPKYTHKIRERIVNHTPVAHNCSTGLLPL